MSGPWEDYQAAAPPAPAAPPARSLAPGPWMDYQQQPPEKPSALSDIAGGIQGGIIRGAVSLPGIPGAIYDLAGEAADMAYRQTGGRLASAIRSGGQSWAAPDQIPIERSPIDIFPRPADMVSAAEGVIGKTYRPQTVPGEYAATAGEFLAGGGGRTLAERAANALIPAAVSETAGQLTKGTSAEPVARAIGGVVGGVGSAAATRPSSAGAAVGEALRNVDQETLTKAGTLMEAAQVRGILLTWPEAVAQASGGSSASFSNLARVVENSRGGSQVMGPYMAERAGQNAAAAEREFGNLGPRSEAPSSLGPDVAGVARQAVQETPAGQALDSAQWAAGPRVTPEQAGQVIQPELRQVYDHREGMRAAQADVDYAAAKNAPELPGVGGTSMPGQPPLQVDPTPVIRSLNDTIASAKGPVQTALQGVRKMMYRPDGNVETSVEGLQNARVALGDMIRTAKRNGEDVTAGKLVTAQKQLDEALQMVPAQRIADQNFAAASKPLEPFGETRGPGQVVQRDQYNRDFTMPPEQVPGTLSTPSAARDFGQVATPAAREAMEGHLTTQILDQAGGGRGLDVNADAIRRTMQANEDTLRQFPAVQDRLSAIAAARDGLEKIQASPLGKLASRDTTLQRTIEVLFPRDPFAGSAKETLDAVTALNTRSPALARQVVRTYLETTFNEASRALQGGANQFGGAGFAKAVRGNGQQAENLAAAIHAVGGPEVLKGVDTFLDILSGQGTRQRAGSNTTFNTEMQEALKKGSTVGDAASLVLGGGVKAPSRIAKAFDEWRLGRNTEQIARMITDPNALPTLRQLAKAEPGSAKAAALAMRLTVLAGQGSAAPEIRR